MSANARFALKTVAASFFVIVPFFQTTSSNAQSGGIGDIATKLRVDTIGPVADLIGSLSFVSGILALIVGIYTLMRHRDNPHDPHNSVGKAIVSFLVGACLIGIPSYAGVGVATLFGAGADVSSVDGTLRTIK